VIRSKKGFHRKNRESFEAIPCFVCYGSGGITRTESTYRTAGA